MGAALPAPHQKFFTMRNPFSRCVLFAVALLFLLAITWKSDRIETMGSHIIKAASHGSSSASNYGMPFSGEWLEGTDQQYIPTTDHVMDCSINVTKMEVLAKKFELADNFQYFKRYIKTHREHIPRKSITKLDQRFLPTAFTAVALDKPGSYGNEKCIEPMHFPVPQSPYPVTGNLSDFMFGVSTTFKRFSSEKTSPVKEWTYWLTDGKGHSNGGKLVLLLLDATEEQMEKARTILTTVGIDVDVYHSDSTMEMAVRYLTLIPTLYDHPERPNKKWLVSCDDDTFFPSVHTLVEKFKQYDPNDMLYIGTLSEDVNNIDRHGSQAFGGAGVFISVPLAARIRHDYQTCKTEQKVHESNSGWGPQGDILLRKCIYENTDVRLSVLHGLYQLDLYGDPSGFYESGVKPITLHHFKGGGWHVALPSEYTKLASICGEDCTLMRFQTADNFILSSGFSVVHYPKGVNFNLAQMERTFAAAPQDKGWNLDYAFGPQRPSLLKTGRKISWDLQQAILNSDNTLTQYYTRKAHDWRWVDGNDVPMSSADGLIELVWMP